MITYRYTIWTGTAAEVKRGAASVSRGFHDHSLRASRKIRTLVVEEFMRDLERWVPDDHVCANANHTRGGHAWLERVDSRGYVETLARYRYGMNLLRVDPSGTPLAATWILDVEFPRGEFRGEIQSGVRI